MSDTESAGIPLDCPETRTGAHRWIRSVITVGADFCLRCGRDATEGRQ